MTPDSCTKPVAGSVWFLMRSWSDPFARMDEATSGEEIESIHFSKTGAESAKEVAIASDPKHAKNYYVEEKEVLP